MMRRQFLRMLGLACAIGLVTSGCGGGTNEVKVTGSVTQGGKPEADVNVGFAPTDLKQGSPKGTKTGADGRFEVMVKPGSYTVILTKMVDKKGQVPPASENAAEDFTQLEASGYLRQVLPAKYADPGSSPLKVDIPPEGKDLPPFDVSK